MSVATVPSLEVEQRREIVQAYKRRRDREMLSWIPGLAAIFVFLQAWKHPDYEIGGLSGPPLLLAATAVLAAYLLHHIFNWRCPACERNFWRGISVPFCRRCGALFEGLRGKLSNPDADYREQAERALQSDLALYKLRYNLHALRGAVVLLGGVLFIILALADDSKLATPDGWLYRTFGEHGVQPAVMAVGGFIGLCGIVWMGFAVRGSTLGLRRYTERMRALLKI